MSNCCDKANNKDNCPPVNLKRNRYALNAGKAKLLESVVIPDLLSGTENFNNILERTSNALVDVDNMYLVPLGNKLTDIVNTLLMNKETIVDIKGYVRAAVKFASYLIERGLKNDAYHFYYHAFQTMIESDILTFTGEKSVHDALLQIAKLLKRKSFGKEHSDKADPILNIIIAVYNSHEAVACL